MNQQVAASSILHCHLTSVIKRNGSFHCIKEKINSNSQLDKACLPHEMTVTYSQEDFLRFVEKAPLSSSRDSGAPLKWAKASRVKKPILLILLQFCWFYWLLPKIYLLTHIIGHCISSGIFNSRQFFVRLNIYTYEDDSKKIDFRYLRFGDTNPLWVKTMLIRNEA